MFRALLCRLGAERFTVSRHENRDLTGSRGKMPQRAVDLRLQVGELRKILQMRGFLLGLAAAAVRNPTVRLQQRHHAPQKRLSRESAFSGKLWRRATYFQMVVRHPFSP